MTRGLRSGFADPSFAEEDTTVILNIGQRSLREQRNGIENIKEIRHEDI